MNNLFLVGSRQNSQKSIDTYIKDKEFSPFETEIFEDEVKIDNSRQIKHSLSRKEKSKKLYIFSGGLTIEAQNALLKSIEESSENIYFIFCCENENSLLPTIRSRCFVVQTGLSEIPDTEILGLIETAQKGQDSWIVIDRLSEQVSKKGFGPVMQTLRFLVLNNTQSSSILAYYIMCKKLLALQTLVKNNNINEKIVIESVFLT
jgi:hypothetical protein